MSRSRALVCASLTLVTVVAGCRRDMQDQPRYDEFERSSFFDDRRASRPRVPGTVARGHLAEDEVFFTGKVGGAHVTKSPVAATRTVLQRGRERFDIYCSPCHDRVGTGRGIVVQRGYKQPTSFHDERLRAVPVGYFFDVMTNGFGVMPAYAAQMPPADRWAIAAYLRALQRSQHASAADVPEPMRASLDTTPPPPPIDAEVGTVVPPGSRQDPREGHR